MGGKAQPVTCVQTTQAWINLLSPLFASKEITLTQDETTGIQWGGVSSIPSQSVWSGMGSVVTASCRAPAGTESGARALELDVFNG